MLDKTRAKSAQNTDALTFRNPSSLDLHIFVMSEVILGQSRSLIAPTSQLLRNVCEITNVHCFFST